MARYWRSELQESNKDISFTNYALVASRRLDNTAASVLQQCCLLFLYSREYNVYVVSSDFPAADSFDQDHNDMDPDDFTHFEQL